MTIAPTRRRRLAVLVLVAAGVARALAQPAPAHVASRGTETFDAAWRLVRDTHFDPTFGGLDWDRVREEFAPRAASARSTSDLRAVIQAMLDRLGQSHFVLLPSGAIGGADAGPDAVRDLGGDVGFDVRLVDESIVVTRLDDDGPAARAGVGTGWIVRAIDGQRMTERLDPLPPTLPQRLRRVEAWRIATTRLRGAPGLTARVEFEDGAGRAAVRSIVRRPETGEPVTVGYLPTFHVRLSRRRLVAGTATIGVIAFNVWMTPVDAPFSAAVDEFRQADGLVIDLRGNPGGLAAMLMGISGHVLDEPRVLGTMRTRESELRFAANPRRVNAAGVRVTPYAGPVAILIDSMTGSASECFAAGLQSIGRARVFGDTSMGQALPARFDRLPNGDVLLHAYGDFQTARGERVEGRGVLPDEPVPLRRADLLAGRDAPLDAAAAWIARGARAAAGLPRPEGLCYTTGRLRFSFQPHPRTAPRGNR